MQDSDFEIEIELEDEIPETDWSEPEEWSESKNILSTLDDLGAISQETGVDFDQIIQRASNLGLTDEDSDDCGEHPWQTIIKSMMGIGSPESVEEYEEPHLFRKKIKIEDESGKQKKSYIYWYDESNVHDQPEKERQKLKPEINKVIEVRRSLTEDEMERKMADEPGKYRIVNGRLISEDWIAANPEKFKKLYGL